MNNKSNTKQSSQYTSTGSGDINKSRFYERNKSFKDTINRIVKLKERKLLKTGILTGGKRTNKKN